MTAGRARLGCFETWKRAGQEERILLSHHGQDIAAMVPVEDLVPLEELQDRSATRATRAALAEIARERTISWNQRNAEPEL
jgi:hypothetical protein